MSEEDAAVIFAMIFIAWCAAFWLPVWMAIREDEAKRKSREVER